MTSAGASYDLAVEGVLRGLFEEETLAVDDYVMAAEEPRRSEVAGA